ncbi:MAG: HAD family hydrolase [Clostridiales bacterium]|jgi:phosphoglycolate phosphatase|nr:HAD family hydrolase [Clostridiales bacterium]
MTKNKLIIFDMDNTLIHSHLDYPLMKAETLRLLALGGVEADESLWVAKIMAQARLHPRMTDQLEEAVWQRLGEIEIAGLAAASPEPGVEQVLACLESEAYLAVLTNNLDEAACLALDKLGLIGYFSFVAGRGRVPGMKPAPDGYIYLKGLHPDACHYLAVGDAVIDLLAANSAGIPFAAYNRSRRENWPTNPAPCLFLQSWEDPEIREKLLTNCRHCARRDKFE